MLNPRQGFKHISNISATFTECQFYGMWRFVQLLSPLHLKTLGLWLRRWALGWRKDMEGFKKKSKPFLRLTGCCLKVPLWGENHRPAMVWWHGATWGSICCTLKPLSWEETEMGPNKSQREIFEFHKAQRLAVFAQFLEEGEVRKKITLLIYGFHKQ